MWILGLPLILNKLQPNNAFSSTQKKGSYGGLDIFKMAVMDAAILEALWRYTARIKYTKANYKGFLRIFLLQFSIDVLF